MDSNNWRVKRDPADAPEKHRTPMRSYQQRRPGQEGIPGSQQGGGRFSSPISSSRDGFRKPLDDEKAERAIEEGRRLYVGNLPYEATVKDVEELFKDIGDGVDAINMSVDPMTGRNPSYCFVDFTSRDLANRVMQEYDGRDFLRRALKVKLGVKSGAGRGRYDLPPRDGNDRPSPVFDRWKRLEEPEAISIAIQERRRVYVGGLPRFENQEDGQTQIRDLLKSAGIEPKVISKMISRHESLRDEEGNHNYCFVDLHSAKDAELAISSLNGLEKWGWNIKVNLSKSTTLGKGQSGRRLFVGGLPEFQGQEATDAAVREIFGGYEVESITKLYTPREEKKSEEGNHHFCFVELADGKQAESAIKELDRKESWGWQIRVKSGLSTGREQKPRTSGGASWGR